jgi:hypothetical protein
MFASILVSLNIFTHVKHNAIVEGGYRRRLGLLPPPSDGGRKRSKPPIKPNCAQTLGQDPQLNDVAADLLLTNVLSGRHAGSLARAGEQPGARGVEALAKTGCKGKCPDNMAKDFMPMVLRGCATLPIYWAVVPVLDETTGV